MTGRGTETPQPALPAELDFDEARTVVCGTTDRADFGRDTHGGGDVDGDGFDDLLAGEWGDYVTRRGTVNLFYGPLPDGQLTTADADAWFRGEHDDDIARAVVSGGDFDGDGVDDIVVGAFTYSGRVRGGGAAFVFTGGF